MIFFLFYKYLGECRAGHPVRHRGNYLFAACCFKI